MGVSDCSGGVNKGNFSDNVVQAPRRGHRHIVVIDFPGPPQCVIGALTYYERDFKRTRFIGAQSLSPIFLSLFCKSDVIVKYRLGGKTDYESDGMTGPGLVSRITANVDTSVGFYSSTLPKALSSISFCSSSFNDVPSASFHSRSPFAWPPWITAAAALGLENS